MRWMCGLVLTCAMVPLFGQAGAAGIVQVPPGTMTKMVVKRVDPQYPLLAKQEHDQGLVILRVRISKTGTVESVKVEQGPPLLQNAARDAVKKWTFKPNLVDGEAVEVETSFWLNFKFDVLGNLAVEVR